MKTTRTGSFLASEPNPASYLFSYFFSPSSSRTVKPPSFCTRQKCTAINTIAINGNTTQ